jgi:hypothetical protein
MCWIDNWERGRDDKVIAVEEWSKDSGSKETDSRVLVKECFH